MINSNYDEHADVLYVFLGSPTPSFSEAEDDGLLLRVSVEDEMPVGVTVTGYSVDWAPNPQKLAERLAELLHVDMRSTLNALPQTPQRFNPRLPY